MYLHGRINIWTLRLCVGFPLRLKIPQLCVGFRTSWGNASQLVRSNSPSACQAAVLLPSLDRLHEPPPAAAPSPPLFHVLLLSFWSYSWGLRNWHCSSGSQSAPPAVQSAAPCLSGTNVCVFYSEADQVWQLCCQCSWSGQDSSLSHMHTVYAACL